MKFRNRTEAGQRLARQLQNYANRASAIVLGLPRGGVPVAYEVASALNLPLDVYVVRKLGVPGHEEMAMGAIATGGVRYISDSIVNGLGISQEAIEQVAEVEQRELERREKAYRDDRPPLDLADHTVILVDDGIATGATMVAAVRSLRQQSLQRVVVAVPVASPEVCKMFESEVDEIICAETPQPFRAVGLWYENFAQTTDQEVRDLLYKAQVQYQTLTAKF
ncbi:MAG: phosphoribosyltransferase [Elainellaceae cyanobacterium]